MNGGSVIGSGGLGNPGPAWHAIGTGDFNGDGRSDILLQNDSGEVVVWELNGTSLIGGGSARQSGAELARRQAPATSSADGDRRTPFCSRTTAARRRVWATERHRL